ncbi:MAG: phosphopentomutase [Bacilli bacterium]|nr:phosphopentomutase [Bacilli bacterium]
MKFKRIFLLVLDSLGVGATRDASNYGDSNANTLGHVIDNCNPFIPNLKKIGFLNTLKLNDDDNVDAYYTIASPLNIAKDSINSHYEMMGVTSNISFKTFNDGIPAEMLDAIERVTERRVIGNKCCSTSLDIINELGERQLNYGALIVYTSADSDLQIASHEDIIPVHVLYEYCERIRQITLREDWRVGRIIARPYTGRVGNFKMINAGRKDYSVKPNKKTILNSLNENNYNVIGIGKINEIFDKDGINKTIKASSNAEVINKLTDIMEKKFTGLCMANLNDFDHLYGHTRDIEGYANALEELDVEIPIILNKLEMDDLLIITADHGNDPTFPGNAHTRENLPVIIYSRSFTSPKKLQPLNTLADIGATIAENFGIEPTEIGKSILDQLQ